MTRSLWLVVLVVALVILVPGGTVAAVVVVRNVTERQKKTRAALRAAARAHGVPEAIPDALAYVESRWNPAAKNEKGPDGARGGSYGATQMSVKTLQAHGADAATIQRIKDGDLDTQAEWTARILAARPGGAPQTVQDAAAWWNAGRTTATSATLPASTRDDYIPKAVAALDYVSKNPVV